MSAWFSGQYATHPDASGYHMDRDNPRWRGHPIPAVCGDRIATFMVYLSSVQLGGGTVFPAIGVTKDAKLVLGLKKKIIFLIYNWKLQLANPLSKV